MQLCVADAKNRLPELIRAVEDGESVTICRRGIPVVDIVRTKKPTGKKRTLGTLKGKIMHSVCSTYRFTMLISSIARSLPRPCARRFP